MNECFKKLAPAFILLLAGCGQSGSTETALELNCKTASVQISSGVDTIRKLDSYAKLSNCSLAEAAPALSKRVKQEPDRWLGMVASRALACLEPPEALIAGFAADSRAEVRARAARACRARLPGIALKLLDDPSPWVRVNAAASLGKEHGPALMKRAGMERDEEVRREIVRQAGIKKSPDRPWQTPRQ